MKHLKYFENNDIDPFGEEDWDEKEKNVINIVKLRNGEDIWHLFIYYSNGEYCFTYLLEKDFVVENDIIIKNELIIPLSEKEIDDIKNDKIPISLFYFNFDNDEISLDLLKFSEVMEMVNVDDVGFLSNI